MTEYLVLFAIVLGINLMPAFGPPTWSVIVLYGLQSDQPVPAIVLTAASAAALGRFLLAHGFRLIGDRLSDETRANLAAARAAVEQNRRNAILALGLFALSPVPSAQLFEAAGLARVKLLGFTAAFFVGRTISYSIYALGAYGIRNSNLGDVFVDHLTSPVGIAIQVGMILLLVLFARLDWARILAKKD
jgi:membrane protein YqaA with SNARE-associated domain